MQDVALRGWRRSGRRGLSSASYRGLLLAGAALVLCAPEAAHAMTGAEAGLRGSQPAAAPPPVESITAAPALGQPAMDPGDGLGPREVYLEADTLVDERETKTMIARGSVEARYQQRTLRADEVIYNTETGAAVARGNVVLINDDGSIEYAKEVTLDDELRSGVATAFAARLADSSTLAAGAAIRRSEDVNELRNAIYTPCSICNDEGEPKEPTWSVQADRVIQDRENQVVYYRNAVVRIKGVPVLYAPIFWHPDPSAPRRSGFLSPSFSQNRRLGITYEQPYLWAISPSADLVVSPQFHSNAVAPLLNLEYRQRFWSGQLNARAGYTYEQRFDGEGKFGNNASRSYVLADGLFQLDPKWRWGFGIEYVTDPTLFARYNIENVFARRGPFTTESQRLISQAYTERQDETSYISVSTIAFQSLRVRQIGNRVLESYDSTGAFPVVAPLIEARFNPTEPVLGGRLRVQAHAVALHRDQDVALITPVGLLQNQAIDTRRASAELDWRATFTNAAGMRIEPFVLARGDAYSTDNPLAATRRTRFARAIGTVGADFSWPFIRQGANSSLILEPLAQIALSPDHRPNLRLPNEDSIALEFDETNLFSPNRFPGFDLYEGGQRINVGGRATYNWGQGRSASLLVGRSFRTDPDPAFFLGSGLEGGSSDWVTSATLAPMRGLSLFTRTRFDSDSLRIRRQEAGVDFTVWRVFGNVRYLYNERDLAGETTQSLNFGAGLNLTRNWGVRVSSSQDLDEGVRPFSQVAVFYQDECIRVEVMFTHDETYASTIVPSNSIQVRLTLATLGGQGR